MMPLKKMVFFLVVWVIMQYSLRGIHANPEGDALNIIKSKLTDPEGALHSWDSTLVSPCSSDNSGWFHIYCNENGSVTKILLGNKGLSGHLAPDIGNLTNLKYLQLYQNKLNGTIPMELGFLKNLLSLGLNDNQLSGHIPESLTQLNSLEILNLQNNKLEGPVPLGFLTFTSSPFTMNVNNNSGLCGPQTGLCIDPHNLTKCTRIYQCSRFCNPDYVTPCHP